MNELDEKIGHFANIEETLNKSILVAQEAAEDVKRNSQKEAKLIVREAEKMPIASSMSRFPNQEKSQWKLKS